MAQGRILVVVGSDYLYIRLHAMCCSSLPPLFYLYIRLHAIHLPLLPASFLGFTGVGEQTCGGDEGARGLSWRVRGNLQQVESKGSQAEFISFDSPANF